MLLSRFSLVLWFVSTLTFVSPAPGQTETNRFSFEDFLLAPVRVHLLSAKHSPAIQTTLTEKDIARILKKVNHVWSQAGLHFYLESLVREEALHQELCTQHDEQVERAALLGMRPMESRATNLIHIYYLKKMSANGIYLPEGIFVKDTASLRAVEGGIDEPLPRVTSHELGHAFGLPHRQNATNLMASGTTGTWLNGQEIEQVRKSAKRFDWITTAPDLMQQADTLFRARMAFDRSTIDSTLKLSPCLPLRSPAPPRYLSPTDL